jgi:hypothetical protein
MTLARIRRRGVFALLAGIFFLIGVPLYQASVLAPAGYVSPDLAVSSSFGPFLTWAAAHGAADAGSRAVEMIPFLLAIGLPGPLRRILWPEDAAQGRIPVRLGQIGFALFAVVLALGFVVVPSFAHAYAQSRGSASVARSYAGVYAFETVAAKGVAVGMIALSLAMVSLRAIATRRLPNWFSYIGLATAGLLAALAVFSLFGLAQAADQAQEFAFPALALWFLCAGVVFMRIQARQRPAAAAVAESAQPSAPTQ